MTDQTPRKHRIRSPLNLGIQWLENRPPVNAVYQRVALWVGIMGAVTGILAVGLGFVLLKEQSDAERARGHDRDVLISCIDRFATDLSGSLPPVRKATQARDRATEVRDATAVEALTGDDGLRGALQKAADGTFEPADMAALLEKFAEFQAAADKVTDANRELERVRKANPYPPPPSTFCDLS